MLLAANFKLEYLIPLWPWGFISIAAMMFVVRPFSVFLCAWGPKMSWREKVFIAWIGPRGIVAASMASIVNLILEEKGMAQEGHLLLALTFSAIMITVVFCGLTARPMAALLHLSSGREPGLLIVGGNELALRIAGMFQHRGCPVLIVDKNPKHCKRAGEKDLHAVCCDALDAERMAEIDLAGIGSMIALTPNTTVNLKALARVAPNLGLDARFAPKHELAATADTWLWMKSNATALFSDTVNWERLFEQTQLSEGRQRTRKFSELHKPDEKNFFLPVLYVNKEGAHPFVAGLQLPPDTEITGLEFDAHERWFLKSNGSQAIGR
jgi:hypothetical protein